MNKVKIAWYGLHAGEEPPLDPAGGIFFTGCDLRCVFCQNYQISQKQMGTIYEVNDLVQIMLKLQNRRAKNIDLVSPSGWYREIKQAIILAKEQGLTLPIVWNSNGYEKLEVLKEMDGVVDVYLPDFKYSDDALAEKYSGIKNYFSQASGNIKEMIRQVGNLKIKDGAAKSGVIVRHLVLPGEIENSFGVLNELTQIDKNIFVSLMNQYFPVFRVKNYPEIDREVSEEEFETVYDYLRAVGLGNGWVQGEKSSKNLLPDFEKGDPFGG